MANKGKKAAPKHEKAAKVEHKSVKKSKSSKKLFVVLIGVILLALIATAAYFVMTKNSKSDDKVILTVNGEKVYQSEANALFGLISRYNPEVTMDAVVDQLVNEKLLLQEAKKSGTTISDAQLDEFINNFLQTNGKTQKDLEQNLNMSYDKARERIKTQMIITEHLNKTIVVLVSDDDAKAFYDANKQYFANATFVQAKQQIVDYLKQQKQMQEVKDYISNLRSTAAIVKTEEKQ